MFAAVCAAWSFLPGASTPVEVDESDVVAH